MESQPGRPLGRVLVGVHKDHVQLSVRILAFQDKELIRLAQAQKRSKREVVVDALSYYMNRMHELGVF